MVLGEDFQSYHTGIEITDNGIIQMNFLIFQSYHTGIEIKNRNQYIDKTLTFQSYHTGIEIFVFI